MATKKQLEKKQEYLETVKWLDSEEKRIDTCGTYDYCVHCDKDATFPCARAFYTAAACTNKQTEYRANVKLSETAKQLTALRSAKGLSIQQVAKAVGIEASELFKYENDKAKPSEAMLHELVSFLQ